MNQSQTENPMAAHHQLLQDCKDALQSSKKELYPQLELRLKQALSATRGTPEGVAVVLQLGRLYSRQRQYDLADLTLRDGLNLSRELLGHGDELTGLLRSAICSNYGARKPYQFEDANKLQAFSDWLEFTRSFFVFEAGTAACQGQSNEAMSIAVGFAEVLTDFGRGVAWAEVEELYETALEQLRLALTIAQDQGHTLQITVLRRMAKIYRLQGRFDEAFQCLEEGYSASTCEHGFAHPITVRMLAKMHKVFEAKYPTPVHFEAKHPTIVHWDHPGLEPRLDKSAQFAAVDEFYERKLVELEAAKAPPLLPAVLQASWGLFYWQQDKQRVAERAQPKLEKAWAVLPEHKEEAGYHGAPELAAEVAAALAEILFHSQEELARRYFNQAARLHPQPRLIRNRRKAMEYEKYGHPDEEDSHY